MSYFSDMGCSGTGGHQSDYAADRSGNVRDGGERDYTAYQLKANSTRSRRQAAGKYPTAAQLYAGRKLINQGVDSLSAAELEALAAHPYFSMSQRISFAAMAARA